MAKLVIIAEVEDSSKWEKSIGARAAFFREHGSVMGLQSPVSFGSREGNRVIVIEEVSDAAKAIESLRSSENLAAMRADGVKVDSVETFVVDKQISF